MMTAADYAAMSDPDRNPQFRRFREPSPCTLSVAVRAPIACTAWRAPAAPVVVFRRRRGPVVIHFGKR